MVTGYRPVEWQSKDKKYNKNANPTISKQSFVHTKTIYAEKRQQREYRNFVIKRHQSKKHNDPSNIYHIQQSIYRRFLYVYHIIRLYKPKAKYSSVLKYLRLISIQFKLQQLCIWQSRCWSENMLFGTECNLISLQWSVLFLYDVSCGDFSETTAISGTVKSLI